MLELLLLGFVYLHIFIHSFDTFLNSDDWVELIVLLLQVVVVVAGDGIVMVTAVEALVAAVSDHRCGQFVVEARLQLVRVTR